MTPKHDWVTSDGQDVDSPAIHRLQETLMEHKVPVDLKTPQRIEVLGGRLNRAMPKLADRSFKEILLAGDAGATAKVLATVWDAARDDNITVGRRLAQVYVTENSSVKIPKGAVSKHDWGEPKRASEETYTFTTITVRKSSGLARISKDMIEDAEWDVVQRQLRELGEAALEFQSNYIVDQMVSDTGSTAAAATSGTLAFADVAKGYANMWNTYNRRADVLVLNPTEFGDLLQDSAVQNWVNYRQTALSRNGQVPYLGDLRIEVTTLIASGTAMLVDTKHAGGLVIRRDITLDEYDDVVKDLVAVPCTQRWMYSSVDANAIRTITSA